MPAAPLPVPPITDIDSLKHNALFAKGFLHNLTSPRRRGVSISRANHGDPPVFQEIVKELDTVLENTDLVPAFRISPYNAYLVALVALSDPVGTALPAVGEAWLALVRTDDSRPNAVAIADGFALQALETYLDVLRRVNRAWANSPLFRVEPSAEQVIRESLALHGLLPAAAPPAMPNAQQQLQPPPPPLRRSSRIPPQSSIRVSRFDDAMHPARRRVIRIKQVQDEELSKAVGPLPVHDDRRRMIMKRLREDRHRPKPAPKKVRRVVEI